MLPQAGQCRGGDPAPREERSYFVAFVGFLAANTSTVADFKDQHDIVLLSWGETHTTGS